MAKRAAERRDFGAKDAQDAHPGMGKAVRLDGIGHGDLNEHFSYGFHLRILDAGGSVY